MSAAVKLLEQCRVQGISRRPGDGFKLKVSPPPEQLPAALREALKCHKADVLALLRQSPAWPCLACGGSVRLEPVPGEEATTRFWTYSKCSAWGATREGAACPVVWVSRNTVQ